MEPGKWISYVFTRKYTFGRDNLLSENCIYSKKAKRERIQNILNGIPREKKNFMSACCGIEREFFYDKFLGHKL